MAFSNDDSVIKALYLRVCELYRKWKNRPITNWAMVRNQLAQMMQSNQESENTSITEFKSAIDHRAGDAFPALETIRRRFFTDAGYTVEN